MDNNIPQESGPKRRGRKPNVQTVVSQPLDQDPSSPEPELELIPPQSSPVEPSPPIDQPQPDQPDPLDQPDNPQPNQPQPDQSQPDQSQPDQPQQTGQHPDPTQPHDQQQYQQPGPPQPAYDQQDPQQHLDQQYQQQPDQHHHQQQPDQHHYQQPQPDQYYQPNPNQQPDQHHYQQPQPDQYYQPDPNQQPDQYHYQQPQPDQYYQPDPNQQPQPDQHPDQQPDQQPDPNHQTDPNHQPDPTQQNSEWTQFQPIPKSLEELSDSPKNVLAIEVEEKKEVSRNARYDAAVRKLIPPIMGKWVRKVNAAKSDDKKRRIEEKTSYFPAHHSYEADPVEFMLNCKSFRIFSGIFESTSNRSIMPFAYKKEEKSESNMEIAVVKLYTIYQESASVTRTCFLFTMTDLTIILLLMILTCFLVWVLLRWCTREARTRIIQNKEIIDSIVSPKMTVEDSSALVVPPMSETILIPPLIQVPTITSLPPPPSIDPTNVFK